MDPTSVATGGFGAGSKLQGGAGGASGDVTTSSTNKSGFDVGNFTFAAGQGKATNSSGMNPWLIGGVVVAALAAFWIYKRK